MISEVLTFQKKIITYLQKNYIEGKMKDAILNSSISKGVEHNESEFTFPLVQSSIIPTQHRGKLDSGYVVCYMVEMICNSYPIDACMTEEELVHYISRVISKFVNLYGNVAN